MKYSSFMNEITNGLLHLVILLVPPSLEESLLDIAIGIQIRERNEIRELSLLIGLKSGNDGVQNELDLLLRRL